VTTALARIAAVTFLMVAATGAVAEPSLLETGDSDYVGWDARVVDSKGVVTDVTAFGFWTGPNVLRVRRGDGTLDVPFRKLRSIEIGDYVADKGASAATLTTRTGKSYAVEIERFDAERLMGGETDLGTYRIRLLQIRRVDLWSPTRATGID
jgi:hypothetical protein